MWQGRASATKQPKQPLQGAISSCQQAVGASARHDATATSCVPLLLLLLLPASPAANVLLDKLSNSALLSTPCSWADRNRSASVPPCSLRKQRQTSHHLTIAAQQNQPSCSLIAQHSPTCTGQLLGSTTPAQILVNMAAGKQCCIPLSTVWHQPAQHQAPW